MCHSVKTGTPVGLNRCPLIPLLIEFYQFIPLATHTEGLGMIERVHAMPRVDALDKMNLPMVGRRTHQIGTGPVERYRVELSQNADVAHLRIGRRRVAIAIDRKVIGYADVENILATVVGNGLGRLGHRFQEIVLCRIAPTGRAGSGRVNQPFAIRRGDTD